MWQPFLIPASLCVLAAFRLSSFPEEGLLLDTPVNDAEQVANLLGIFPTCKGEAFASKRHVLQPALAKGRPRPMVQDQPAHVEVNEALGAFELC